MFLYGKPQLQKLDAFSSGIRGDVVFSPDHELEISTSEIAQHFSDNYMYLFTIPIYIVCTVHAHNTNNFVAFSFKTFYDTV